jgi:methionyl-tRNA formyltransferase
VECIVNVVFFGSGAFAVPSLEALVSAGHRVTLVVAQPDREKGRGRSLAAPPLKVAALGLGLPVFQPARIKSAEALPVLAEQQPEIQVVVAYGQILPRTVFDGAPRGTLNVHASLLPRYRGAAPIQWAIANGEEVTGVTTMLIDEGLDTGATLLAARTPIGPDETAPTLERRLASLGAAVLLQTLTGLAEGGLTPTPQDHAAASFAPTIRKSDGQVDWQRTAVEIARRVRAFDPWPGSFTTAGGRLLKILRARPSDAASSPGSTPGCVTSSGPRGFCVVCGGDSQLEIAEVQPESRRPMSANAFLQGARLAIGSRLG